MNGGGAGSPVDATAGKLLNFAEPLDVSLLDTTVDAFYGAGTNEQVCYMFIYTDETFVYRLASPIEKVRSRCILFLSGSWYLCSAPQLRLC